MDLIKLIIERWSSETPSFFSGIKKIAIILGSFATAILVASQSGTLELNETFVSLCKYVISACTTMGLTSQLTMVPKK